MKRKLLLATFLTPLFVISPSYATDLPNEVVLNYTGPYGIPATMTFTHNKENYTIDTTVLIPFNKMRFIIKGQIKGNQLLPTEYTVFRSDKAYSSAIIDYNKNIITYGKLPERKQESLAQNTQDLFSVAWQMSINQGLPNKNTQTTDGKKIYQLPELTQTQSIEHRINGKKENSIYFKGGEDDRRLEIGLATEQHFIPSVIVYYDKGTRYELTLRKSKITHR
ncbi:hypothetical protein [Wohlfahrtiimonas larvae]|uniref:DUF3108 domain-containing protein n=1 Tax=Wohlfahrtiimonas larvae TaxID=1157986 RepID=A0ABP9MTF3_9GAMM|nr:hypothetical protein [Wohlfahrtiimonas larvae]